MIQQLLQTLFTWLILQAREPDRRCFLTYDKLIVDDNVYIFNDLEGRIEKLPHKVCIYLEKLFHEGLFKGRPLNK